MAEMSLAAFIAHVASLPVEIAEAEHHAMERAAKLIEEQAKSEVGHYQTEHGPFAAWAELADATKEDRVRLGFTENDPGLRTGEMRDSIGHAVGDREAVIGSNDDKLVYFELGTDKQPPRSVLGSAAVIKGGEVAEMIGGSIVAAIAGREYSPAVVRALTGT